MAILGRLLGAARHGLPAGARHLPGRLGRQLFLPPPGWRLRPVALLVRGLLLGQLLALPLLRLPWLLAGRLYALPRLSRLRARPGLPGLDSRPRLLRLRRLLATPLPWLLLLRLLLRLRWLLLATDATCTLAG